MWLLSLKHAARQTWAKRAGSLFVALAGIAVALAIYSSQPGQQMTDHATTALVALLGSLGGVVLIFLFNFAAAPYRIEKAKRMELELAGPGDPAPTAAIPAPDMTIRELFEHIQSTRGQPDDDMEKTGLMIRDRSSLGSLHVWGRKVSRDVTQVLFGEQHVTELVPADYWKLADFDYVGIFDRRAHEALNQGQTIAIGPRDVPLYRDLRVNRAQVKSIWPDPAKWGP